MTKPTAACLDPAHLFYPGLRMACAFVEKKRVFPCAQRANAAHLPDVLGIPTPGIWGQALGPVAKIVLDDAVHCPALRFDWGTTAYLFPNMGAAGFPGGGAITYVGTVRPRFGQLAGWLENAAHSVIGCSGNSETAHGPGFYVAPDGSIQFSLFRTGPYGGSSILAQAAVLSNIALSNDEWYTYAIKRTSLATTFWVYRHSTSTVLTATGGTAGISDAALLFDGDSNHYVLNPYPTHLNTKGMNNLPLLADVSFQAISDLATFGDLDFALVYPDPSGIVRGTSNGLPAAAMYPPQLAAYADDRCVYLGVTRAPHADQEPAIKWHRDGTQGFTLATGTVFRSGEYDQTVTDLTPDDDAPFFACEQTDANETVQAFMGSAAYGYPSARPKRGAFRLALFGDSHTGINQNAYFLGNTLSGRDYLASICVNARSGSAAYHATNYLSWQPGRLQAGAMMLDRGLGMIDSCEATTIMLMLGSNDPGQATSAADFEKYMAIIIRELLTVRRVKRVVLNLPPPRFDTLSYAALQHTYLPVYESLCNGRTILLGDTKTARWATSSADRRRDDHHHGSRALYQVMAENQADRLIELLG